MEIDEGTSPSYFDPENLSTRERFRRYGLEAHKCEGAHNTERCGGTVEISSSLIRGLILSPEIEEPFDEE
uniref:Uncharacterized protein n=1 Tax=Solanum tuberosum TaxID=4113 RepID=M0ZZ47_SOLTU